jgi:hypothetical protein
MRVKKVVGHFHLRARAKLVWSRITLSRLTTTYFVITAVHCIVQIVLQSHAFSINATAADGLWSLLVKANETGEAQGLAIFSDDLRICYKLPDRIDRDECTTIVWSGHHITAPIPTQPVQDNVPVSPSVLIPIPSVAPVVTASGPTTSTHIITVDPSKPSVRSTILGIPTHTPTPTGIENPIINSLDDDAGVGLTSSNDDHQAHGETTIDDDDNGFSLADIVEQLENGRSKRKRGVLVVDNLDSQTVNVTGIPIDGLDASTPVTLSRMCIQTLIWPVQTLDNTKREDITLIGFQIWVMGMSVVALLNESIPHIFAAVVTQFLVAVWTINEVFETQSFRSNFVRLTVNGACGGHNLLGSYWSQRKNAEIASAALNAADVIFVGFLSYKLVKIYSWQTYKRIGASLTINRVYKLVLCLSVAIQLALFFIVAVAGLWLDQLYHGAAARLSDHRTLYIVFLTLIACSLVPWLTLGWFAIRREMRKACGIFLILNVAFIVMWAALYGSNSFRWTFTLWTFFAVMSIAAGILVACTLGLGLACRLNFGKGLTQYLNIQEPADGVDFAPVVPDGRGEKSLDPEKVDFPCFDGHSPTYPAFNQTYGDLRVPDKVVYHERATSKSSLTSTHLARTDTSTSDTSQGSTDSDRKMGKRMVIE